MGLSVALTMVEPIHAHAKADQCSLPVVLGGRRVVSYQGEDYFMLGLYFAGSSNGHRELYYILRLLDGDERSNSRS